MFRTIFFWEFWQKNEGEGSSISVPQTGIVSRENILLEAIRHDSAKSNNLVLERANQDLISFFKCDFDFVRPYFLDYQA